MLVIVNARYGQLSNRIITVAHAMATAIELGVPLRLTAFDDIKSKYECQVCWPGVVIIRGSWFWRAERTVYSIMQRLLHLPDIPGIVSGWNYRDYMNMDKHHDQIAAFFTPRQEAISYAVDFEQRYFRDEKVIVGVHIRRGDYAWWQGGKFYFEDEIYAAVMDGLAEELRTVGMKIRFVLFSNEGLNLDHFKGMYEVVRSDGSPYDDHWIMSKCDYLVGPPSTFTIWASWYGRVPLCHLKDRTARPHLIDFQWAKGC